MSVTTPKGLTAAVLATQAMAFIPDVETGFFIRNIVFSVILFSIVINSILIPLIARKRNRGDSGDSGENTSFSDVLVEAFKDQDTPGALSHPVSSNSDVAD